MTPPKNSPPPAVSTLQDRLRSYAHDNTQIGSALMREVATAFDAQQRRIAELEAHITHWVGIIAPGNDRALESWALRFKKSSEQILSRPTAPQAAP